MKNLFFLLLFVTAFATAQTEKDIAGKWKFKDIQPTTDAKPEAVTMLKKMMAGYVAAFNPANMRYVAHLLGKNEGGIWQLKDKALVFTPEEGASYSWPVAGYSANELLLEVKGVVITFEKVTGTAPKQ